MAKIPRLPAGSAQWAPEDRTPAFGRSGGAAPSSLEFPPEVFLNESRARHWMKLDSWTVEEAGLLWMNFDPTMLRAWAASTNRQLVDVLPIDIVPRMHALRAAHQVGALTFPSAPGAVLGWAHAKGWPMPGALISSSAVRGSDADAYELTRPVDETPADRRSRLASRLAVLKADGRRAPTRRLAEEEGVSVGRVRELIREKTVKPKAVKPATPFGGLGGR